MISDRKLKTGTLLRMRTIADHAQSMALVRERADSHAWLTGANGTTLCSSIKGDSKFCATGSIEIYEKMLALGWPQAMRGMKEELDGITADNAERLEFVRNVGGAFPIVPAYLAGSPCSMLAPVQQVSEQVKGLTLIVNGAFNCQIKASDAKEYAESVMRLVAWLQAERLDAAVYVAMRMSLDDSVHALYLTPLRTLGDVFQPERIAACCHPSFLRRAWFAMLELEYCDHAVPGSSAVQGGYGRSIVATLDEFQEALPDAQSIIMLPAVGSGDPRKAVQEAITLKLRRG